jgi:hypothetical protein
MKLSELIKAEAVGKGTGLIARPLRRRVLRAVLTDSHPEKGPTLRLLREQLLSRAGSIEYQ